MAKIRKLYDETIKPDGNKTTIYPVTSTRAVYTPTSITLDTLLSEGYRFGGIVVPDSLPIITNQRVFYGASTPGTYTAFGGITVDSGEAVFIMYNGQSWTKSKFSGNGFTSLTGFKTLSSTVELPTTETQYGYLINGYLYVWVGQDGDTLGGLYLNCGKLRGASAYDIAVEHGFSGTEAEWLNSLQGQRGYTGATGPTGPAGITSVAVTVDDQPAGAPSVTYSLEDGELSLTFSGLKGDTGDSGYTGASGELRVVANLDDGDDYAALSASMGYYIKNDLYPPVHPNGEIAFPVTEKYVTYGGYEEPGGTWNSGGWHGAATPIDEQHPETAMDCSDYYRVDEISKIEYCLCSRNTNTAVISYWKGNYGPLYVGTVGVDRHEAGLQGTNYEQTGTLYSTDFPEGAVYVQFCSTRDSHIVPASHPELAFDFERSVNITFKRGEKFLEREDFQPFETSALGTDYEPLIANANPNNSGNSTDIRSNSAIPVSKGDVVTVTFKPELGEGQYLRYIFAGSDDLVTLTSLGNHRTERNPDDGQISNRYIISSDATKGICVGLRLKNADGTTDATGLRPATKFDVGDLVINVQKADSLAGRLANLEQPNAFVRNADKADNLGSACRFRQASNFSKDFQLLILTDSHDDNMAVLNGVKMANGFETIDAIIHLGDMTGNAMKCNETLDPFIATEKTSTKPFYNVIGNHEAGTYNAVGAVPSQAHMYNVFIAPMVERGYLEYGEYIENKCYYYHDFATPKIRLIVLNEFDGDLTLDDTYWETVPYNSQATKVAWNTTYQPDDVIRMVNSELYYDEYCFRCKQQAKTGSGLSSPGLQTPRYIYGPKNRYISEQQAQWFLDTLYTTPTDYSVVVAMHQVFSPNTTTQVDKKFCQNINATGANSASNLMQTDLIADAVNAFIHGTNFAETVRYVVNGVTYCYDISKDFSHKASGTKFMCYLGGHSHKDLIWKHDTYDKQWMVAPICTNAEGYHQCPGADIRRSRIFTNPNYDCLTTIAFNTTDRTISLTKLGVDVTDEMTPRDYEKIALI